MYPQRHVVTIVTNDSGAGSGYTPVVNGRVLQIQYVKTDFVNGVDVDITGEETGQVILDKDNVDAAAIFAPRQPTHDTGAVASLYAAGGEPVEDFIYISNERIKIVVANGGDTKTGTFHVMVG